MNNTALIVVDVQNDFMPGGALPVPNGNEVVPYINELIKEAKKQGQEVVYTMDWHPPMHCSFKEYGGIWPVHCQEMTEGARLHADLDVPMFNPNLFYKGNEHNKDSYSGFGGRKGFTGDNLETFLKKNNVTHVVVVGLAFDYCIKATALEARDLGFDVMVDLEGTRAVFPEKNQETMQELLKNNVMILE